MTTTVTNDIILTAASVEVAAAEKQPSISIVAYTGGVMKVGGWGDLAINLSGLDCGGQIPLLVDHDPSFDNVLGKGQAAVRIGQLHVVGNIVGSTPAAKKVLDLARDNFPLQASVGVMPEETVRLEPGAKVTINGQAITVSAAGLTLVKKGKLREVSVVTLGCDSQTSVSIAASKGGESVNDSDEMIIERQRVAAIMKISAKFPDITAMAITEGWDSTRAELEVLRASRPKPPRYYAPPPVATSEIIEAALALRMGLGGVAEKYLSPYAMEQGHQLGATHALDLCKAALIADGIEVPRGKEAMVRAALSSFSLPQALGNIATRSLLDAYTEAPASWRSFAAIRSATDFRTQLAIRPSFTGGLEHVPTGGQLKHGSMKEWAVQYQVDTFGKLLGVDRRELINDDLGVFADASGAMGKAAMRKLSDLVFTVLMGNAGGFFSTNNGNFLSGAASALGMTSLSNAIKAMLSQRDDEGNDLDIRPAVLLVTPELETTARALLESEFIQAQVNTPTGNSLRGVVKLEVEPRLANDVKFGNAASNTQWYLFGPTSSVPVVVAFLNGNQTPIVEYQGIESDINTLSASWRVYHDFGAALADPRAAVRSKGAE